MLIHGPIGCTLTIGPEWIWTMPSLATKHMIGSPSATAACSISTTAPSVKLPGIVVADRAYGVLAADLQLFQHAEELVGVGEPAPVIAKRLAVHGIYRRARIIAALILGDFLALVVEAKFGNHRVIGIDVGSRAQMNLVDGTAGLVEVLQAQPLLIAVLLGDGEAVRPAFRENAQVDVFAKNHGCMLAGVDVFVDADLLVNRAFVARQRHDLAEAGYTFQEAVRVGVDACRGQSHFGRYQRRLGNSELSCDVALAHLRVFGTESADFGGCRSGRFSHLVHAYLLRISLPWRVIFMR